MRLYDLVHDRQAEAGAAFEVALERLEDLLGLLRTDAEAGIGKADDPAVVEPVQADRQPATVRHRAERVLAQVPEDLLHLVPINSGPSFGFTKVTLDLD